MKISLNWIRDYVALDAPVAEITRAITFLGFEVEHVASTGRPEAGERRRRRGPRPATSTRTPTSSRSARSTSGPAGGVKTIVCGAQNYKVGDRVPVALPGRGPPGRLQDQAVEDPRPALRRHDVLGQGARASATTRAASSSSRGGPPLGAPINDVLPPGDTVFDIEVTPNRPDCLSHLGIARELAAWFRKDLVYPQEKFRGDVGDGEERRSSLPSRSTAPRTARSTPRTSSPGSGSAPAPRGCRSACARSACGRSTTSWTSATT